LLARYATVDLNMLSL